MSNCMTEKTKLHFIKAESTAVPVINYSGFDEQQEYSDDYIFQETEVIDARLANPEQTFSLDKEGFELASFNKMKLCSLRHVIAHTLSPE